MVGSRTLTALAGLAVSLLVTAIAWRYFGVGALFVFLPFVPVLFRRRGGDPDPDADVGNARSGVRRCPVCGYESRDADHAYCPRDGTRLRSR